MKRDSSIKVIGLVLVVISILIYILANVSSIIGFLLGILLGIGAGLISNGEETRIFGKQFFKKNNNAI